MIIVFRRRHLLAALCLLFAALSAFAIFYEKKTASVFSLETAGETIIIDAGHGGADGGAVSKSGIIESELNLQIARKIDALFRFLGEETVMTRTGENGLYDPDSQTIRQKKVADTRNRVTLINGYDPSILISIHQNSMPNAPKVRGAQVFYNTKPHAQELANSVQTALNTAINIENEKSVTPISKNVYIMAHANCDAILVECGFLSNADEAELLQQGDYQRKLAAAIVSGYLEDKG